MTTTYYVDLRGTRRFVSPIYGDRAVRIAAVKTIIQKKNLQEAIDNGTEVMQTTAKMIGSEIRECSVPDFGSSLAQLEKEDAMLDLFDTKLAECKDKKELKKIKRGRQNAMKTLLKLHPRYDTVDKRGKPVNPYLFDRAEWQINTGVPLSERAAGPIYDRLYDGGEGGGLSAVRNSSADDIAIQVIFAPSEDLRVKTYSDGYVQAMRTTMGDFWLAMQVNRASLEIDGVKVFDTPENLDATNRSREELKVHIWEVYEYTMRMVALEYCNPRQYFDTILKVLIADRLLYQSKYYDREITRCQQQIDNAARKEEAEKAKLIFKEDLDKLDPRQLRIAVLLLHMGVRMATVIGAKKVKGPRDTDKGWGDYRGATIHMSEDKNMGEATNLRSGDPRAWTFVLVDQKNPMRSNQRVVIGCGCYPATAAERARREKRGIKKEDAALDCRYCMLHNKQLNPRDIDWPITHGDIQEILPLLNATKHSFRRTLAVLVYILYRLNALKVYDAILFAAQRCWSTNGAKNGFNDTEWAGYRADWKAWLPLAHFPPWTIGDWSIAAIMNEDEFKVELDNMVLTLGAKEVEDGIKQKARATGGKVWNEVANFLALERGDHIPEDGVFGQPRPRPLFGKGQGGAKLTTDYESADKAPKGPRTDEDQPGDDEPPAKFSKLQNGARAAPEPQLAIMADADFNETDEGSQRHPTGGKQQRPNTGPAANHLERKAGGSGSDRTGRIANAASVVPKAKIPGTRGGGLPTIEEDQPAGTRPAAITAQASAPRAAVRRPQLATPFAGVAVGHKRSSATALTATVEARRTKSAARAVPSSTGGASSSSSAGPTERGLAIGAKASSSLTGSTGRGLAIGAKAAPKAQPPMGRLEERMRLKRLGLETGRGHH